MFPSRDQRRSASDGGRTLASSTARPTFLRTYAAPARANDLSDLPSTFISAGTVDGLRDEAMDFAERLALAGVDVDAREYEGGVHNFATLAPDSMLARRVRHEQAAWLSAHMGQ